MAANAEMTQKQLKEAKKQQKLKRKEEQAQAKKEQEKAQERRRKEREKQRKEKEQKNAEIDEKIKTEKHLQNEIVKFHGKYNKELMSLKAESTKFKKQEKAREKKPGEKEMKWKGTKRKEVISKLTYLLSMFIEYPCSAEDGQQNIVKLAEDFSKFDDMVQGKSKSSEQKNPFLDSADKEKYEAAANEFYKKIASALEIPYSEHYNKYPMAGVKDKVDKMTQKNKIKCEYRQHFVTEIEKMNIASQITGLEVSNNEANIEHRDEAIKRIVKFFRRRYESMRIIADREALLKAITSFKDSDKTFKEKFRTYKKPQSQGDKELEVKGVGSLHKKIIRLNVQHQITEFYRKIAEAEKDQTFFYEVISDIAYNSERHICTLEDDSTCRSFSDVTTLCTNAYPLCLPELKLESTTKENEQQKKEHQAINELIEALKKKISDTIKKCEDTVEINIVCDNPHLSSKDKCDTIVKLNESFANKIVRSMLVHPDYQLVRGILTARNMHPKNVNERDAGPLAELYKMAINTIEKIDIIQDEKQEDVEKRHQKLLHALMDTCNTIQIRHESQGIFGKNPLKSYSMMAIYLEKAIQNAMGTTEWSLEGIRKKKHNVYGKPIVQGNGNGNPIGQQPTATNTLSLH